MISVCVATYNGEKFIREQLDSILAQIDSDDEVIVSDDGSTDKTLDIIESYNDRRITILRHDVGSMKTAFPLDRPTHNFEYALRHANGDIIFLSDQDDVWIEGKVNRMLAALCDADFAVHDCVVMDGSLNDVVEPSYFSYIGARRGVWNNFVKASYLGCCMAFRRKVLDKALPFPETCVGHDLWLGIVADMKFRTTLVKEPLVRYRKHENSMTTSGKKSKYGLWFKLSYRFVILKHILLLYLR